MNTRAAGAVAAGAGASPWREFRIGSRDLSVHLDVPAKARGIVVIALARETGSACLQAVAEAVRGQRLASLQVQLLGDDERTDERRPDDIALLAERTCETLDWLREQAVEGHSSIGLCAMADAAAGVLRAAGERPAGVAALVAVCGRTDLAADWLPRVQAATLFVVGGEDGEMLRQNRQSFSSLRCLRRLEIIPRARHADDDEVTCSTVAHLAAAWLAHHLGRVQAV